MKRIHFFVSFLAFLVIETLASCSEMEKIEDTVFSSENKFLTTFSNTYHVNLTRSIDKKELSVNTNNVKTNITEEDWVGHDAENTRALNISNKVYWDDAPNVAIYIKENQDGGNLIAKDIPLNPTNHDLYSSYYNPDDYGSDINNSATKEKVKGASFFWDKYGAEGTADSWDFYGYSPRPYNKLGDNVKYTGKSVVNETDARSEANMLKYDFPTEQTDNNLSYYDLMVAVPEEESQEIYGSKAKNKGDNIQMRFKHMFSCLVITINRGSYQGDCKISSLTISGTQVKIKGTVDILNGIIEPGEDYEPITRSIPIVNIEEDKPFETEMILQPTTDDDIADLGTDSERLKLNCIIDGTEYSCSFPSLKLEGGKKYHLDLTLTPTEIVTFQVWDGAKIMLDQSEHGKGQFKLTQKNISTFTVSATDANVDVYVCKDGVLYPPTSGSTDVYDLQIDKGKNTIYNIVACPKNDTSHPWYITDARAVHFDAIWNDKFSKDSQMQSSKTWSDLSGHNNDGTLIAFDNPSSSSGWRNGLNFDGIDDLVTFPGNLNEKEFTIELYVYIEKKQNDNEETKPYKRLFGEPENMNAGFLSFYIGRDQFGFFGLGQDTYFGNNNQIVSGEKVQYDFIYKDNTIKAYKNGELGGELPGLLDVQKQTLASIGGRIKDKTRNLCGTYYSVIIYDKALTEDEMNNNMAINKARYK